VAPHAALEACARDGLRVGVAVTDSAGTLQLGLTADGATPGRIFMATRKDIAALAFKSPTSVVQQKLRDKDAAALAALKPNMVVYPGAVPLMAGERVLGAIGASGATGEQDQACAAAGAAKIQARLK
jgi:uncharacterized protein GlcG (DUF336 family)